jgi:hypothetical protein
VRRENMLRDVARRTPICKSGLREPPPPGR